MNSSRLNWPSLSASNSSNNRFGSGGAGRPSPPGPRPCPCRRRPSGRSPRRSRMASRAVCRSSSLSFPSPSASNSLIISSRIAPSRRGRSPSSCAQPWDASNTGKPIANKNMARFMVILLAMGSDRSGINEKPAARNVMPQEMKLRKTPQVPRKIPSPGVAPPGSTPTAIPKSSAPPATP